MNGRPDVLGPLSSANAWQSSHASRTDDSGSDMSRRCAAATQAELAWPGVQSPGLQVTQVSDLIRVG
jgi:hypothetical protein